MQTVPNLPKYPKLNKVFYFTSLGHKNILDNLKQFSNHIRSTKEIIFGEKSPFHPKGSLHGDLLLVSIGGCSMSPAVRVGLRLGQKEAACYVAVYQRGLPRAGLN